MVALKSNTNDISALSSLYYQCELYLKPLKIQMTQVWLLLLRLERIISRIQFPPKHFFCTKGSFLAPERMALTRGLLVDATF